MESSQALTRYRSFENQNRRDIARVPVRSKSILSAFFVKQKTPKLKAGSVLWIFNKSKKLPFKASPFVGQVASKCLLSWWAVCLDSWMLVQQLLEIIIYSTFKSFILLLIMNKFTSCDEDGQDLLTRVWSLINNVIDVSLSIICKYYANVYDSTVHIVHENRANLLWKPFIPIMAIDDGGWHW